MSKVSRQTSGLVDVRAMAAAATGFGGRVTRASSTTAAASKSIVSTIEVNMESSSYSETGMVAAHCKPNAPPPPPVSVAAAAAAAAAVKKKRLALGNISNADGVQTGGQSNNPPIAPKDAKKSRFSGANIVSIAMPFGQRKTTEQAAAKKTTIKASSKENLHQLQVPPVVMRKSSAAASKKPTTAAESVALSKMSSVSKSENDIKRQVDSLSLAVEVASSSSTTSLTTNSTSNVRIERASSTIESTTPKHMTPEQMTGWEDIDVADTGDEFASADYVNGIFKYYRDRENTFVVNDYLSAPKTNINRQMRVLLVDWMVEVQQQLEFNHEVLYLSVKLLDLYLTRHLVDKEALQLLAAASMFIACKFEERMPPVIDDFILVSDNAYARKEMIMMEMEILKMVKFDLGVPLSYTFLRRYAKCIHADMKFLTLARYILELSLQDYTFAPERDSLKACAALYLAMKMAVSYESVALKTTGGFQTAPNPNQLLVTTSNLTSTEWNPTLIHYTNTFVQDFSHLIQPMNNLVKNALTNKYKTIFRKYSHPVFFEVAKVPALSDYQIDQMINSNKMVH